MSLLGKFLLRHLMVYLLGVWVLLTVCIFFLGIIEFSMNELSKTVERDTISIFAAALRDRMIRLPQYASETMAYAGLAGCLLGFWSLWQRGEFLQYQLLGGRKLLLRYAVLSGLLFGTLHAMVIESWKHRQNRISDDIVHQGLQIVRTTAQGGKIMLFADRYYSHNGLLKGNDSRGVDVLVLDENFRVRTIFNALRGRIKFYEWLLLKGTRLEAEGKRTFFTKKRFPTIKTDMAALAYALQPNPQVLSFGTLWKAFRAARDNARDTKPFVDRAFFLISLPLFYASFGMLAYALCLTLPHRTTGARMAFFVILLPCTIEFVRHIAWSRVFADSLHPILPAFCIPLAFACTTGFLMRNERLFS